MRNNLDDEWIEVLAVRPKVWLPNEDGASDILEGTVIKFVNSEYGLQAIVETDNHELFATPNHKLLQSKLDSLVLYDTIRIIYAGQVKLTSGRRANNYIVSRKKRNEELANKQAQMGKERRVKNNKETKQENV